MYVLDECLTELSFAASGRGSVFYRSMSVERGKAPPLLINRTGSIGLTAATAIEELPDGQFDHT